MTIPWANPQAAYVAYQVEIDAALRRVLQSGCYILGPEVEAFEAEFAAYCGAAAAAGVGSGTEALHLALAALGIGPGDEVVTVAHTAVATVSAIEMCGARPVLVDVDPASYTLDPQALRAGITPRTRAVIPVHLYGQAADLDPILDVARRQGIAVVEDCAQAHGATYRGRRVGTWGDVGCFSFYPTKNLGAFGDGGAVVSCDAALAERVRLLRQYGWRERYTSSIAGWNSRLDELQAALLRVRLAHLEEDNARRRRLAGLYGGRLAGGPVALPAEMPYGEHVYHLYVVRSAWRDELQRFLAARGVQTGIHYPVPVHLQPAYSRLGCGPGALPVTERLAAEILSLPMFPELSADDAGRVAAAVCEFA
ncbi:MAG TPA: DegT/DnrJ/EryC1/StrS family aminotransferase [Anaerolineae bacterium]|nr:DegT/DnrJ/EryC1/StrS family aminotransferase [Anaerolineae bacterium]HOQ97861.1 DegT/DnrJ/EryC1/StrS family aminotransferase [Anaerolineae bacterium]HPL26966.1 DegT/DnrJ/EryC1/StrS family aminotransferase [Anaerolineae bacterium]